MLPIISIIIPVYNGNSHYLPECLDSIWNQKINDTLYEVLCVDDCSIDDTLEWLQEQKQKHSNLNIIQNTKNIRQGGARNNGIKHANGHYILFIDQDDYYHTNSLSKVIEHITKHDLDILICDSAYQLRDHESNQQQLNFKYTDITDGISFVKKNGWVFAPWRLCVRKDFLLSNNIKFEENVRIEDVDWAVKLLFYAKKVQYLPIILIHYNKGTTGTTDNMFKNYETLKSNIIAGNRTYELANTLYSYSEIKYSVLNVADYYYYYSCKCMLGLYCSISQKMKLLKLIPKDLKSQYFLVRFVKHYSTLFCYISTLTIPLYRILIIIKKRKKSCSN